MAAGFREKLEEGIVLCDGAMGTMLYDSGIFINRCFDEVTLSNPSLVEKIHRQYLAAGADVIETNTFGANRFKLKLHGLDSQTREINLQGARLARRVAGGNALVAGSIGPLGLKIEPWGPTSNEEAEEVFREQGEALLEGGVDLFILETFADLNEIHQALKGLKKICDLPIVAQMTLQFDGLGLYGTEPGEFAVRLSEWQADVVGINCTVGPKIMLEALEKMVKAVNTYISIQPNAGIPQNVDGRNIYLTSPEYMAEYARRFVAAGARMIGGCCGTTPAHIRAIHEALRTVKPVPERFAPRKPTPSPEPTIRAVPRIDKSRLSSRLARGEFARIVELVPPRGWDTKGVIRAASALAGASV
nr:homocysteine S-methyltransferase family protein [Candidatus Krumholzibacteriota bacterium]